jgi:cytidine deaminase
VSGATWIERELLPSEQPLLAAALATREQAYAPYSGWAVGAAVEDHAGRCHGGCNIENASYSLTICAERVALFRAQADGATPLRRVLVVAAGDEPPAPCGACRQVLLELAGSAEVLLVRAGSNRARVIQVADLLPLPFRGAGAGEER